MVKSTREYEFGGEGGKRVKQRRKRQVTAVAGLAVVAAVLLYLLVSVRPLAAMDADEIREIRVYAMHPGEEVILNEEETARAVSLLRDLKVSRPGYILLPLGWGGQTVSYTVQKTDGSSVVISNFGNIRITVDGVRYRADYETANAISKFANHVLDTGF